MQNQSFDGNLETWSGQALQLGPELRNKYGDQFRHVVMSSGRQSPILSYNEKPLTKTGNFMEAEAPEMLSLDLIKGTRSGLKEINTILLSESTATSFFGDRDCLGLFGLASYVAEQRTKEFHKNLCGLSFSPLTRTTQQNR